VIRSSWSEPKTRTSRMARAPKRDDAAQSKRFIEAARELDTDNDPERFKATVRKIAKAPPAPNPKPPSKSKAER
jgi:hypothetical protein